MGAVGIWRIIPRIRTGLKPLDHQIDHLQGWTPSYRCTKPAWDLTICHYLRSKTYLAPVGRLTKQLWELVNFVYPRGEKKKLRPTGGDAENQLGGKLVNTTGGSMLTATARPSIPGFFGAANCFSLNISLGFNVWENSSMFGWAWLYCESRNTIHTILENSRFSSWHFGFAVDYDHRHHCIFGTKDDWMSWMKKHKTLYSWLQFGGCFLLDLRTREWGSQQVTSDSGTESATTLLEFIGDSVRASSYMQLPGWSAST